MDFKKKSRPFFIIIFKLKNCKFKTRDFSPLIERVLAGVYSDVIGFLEFKKDHYSHSELDLQVGDFEFDFFFFNSFLNQPSLH